MKNITEIIKNKKTLYGVLFIVGVFWVYISYIKMPERVPIHTERIIIDSLVVYKSKRQLLSYSKGKLVKSYKISLGRNPIGHKHFENDQKTPEGTYSINDKNPHSRYYKNLGISYPNKKDIAYAKIYGRAVGGDIKIHGVGSKLTLLDKFQSLVDWTSGCIAVSNQEIDELYSRVPIGTKIVIRP